jgi:flagellar hook-basal body complex protein FliE
MILQPQILPLHHISSYRPGIPDAAQTAREHGSFDSIYQTAINLFDETNRYQKEADRVQLDFASGKTDNILSVMLAQEKAYSSLNLTVQATNKIIESYREIMRMQL